MSAAADASRLAQVLEVASRKLASLSDDEAARRPGPGRWAPKELLGHLIDSAANNHQRFVRGQLSRSIELPNYEQESWVAAQSYLTEPWLDLVNLWRLFNLHLIHILRTMPESALATSVTIGGDPAAPLASIISSYVDHLEHHLEQIFG
jgi:hypothetical protein